jgi:hypothetical protein
MASDLLIGLIVVAGAALALWSFSYFASRRPRGYRRAAAHVIAAYFVIHAAKPAVKFTVGHVPHPYAMIIALAVITLPAMAYMLLTWLWLLACVQDAMGGPSDGHRRRVRERVPERERELLTSPSA